MWMWLRMVGRETRRGSKVWCKSTTADVGVVADGGGERRDMGLKSSVCKSTTADVVKRDGT